MSSWLVEEGLEGLVDTFRANNMDGSELISLTKETLASELHIGEERNTHFSVSAVVCNLVFPPKLNLGQNARVWTRYLMDYYQLDVLRGSMLVYARICIFVPLYMDRKVTQTIKVSVKERKSVDEGFTRPDYIILDTSAKVGSFGASEAPTLIWSTSSLT